jgi:hypothetical protein
MVNFTSDYDFLIGAVTTYYYLFSRQSSLHCFSKVSSISVLKLIKIALIVKTERSSIHHHQPNNVPTAGAQAFLMEYT